MLCIKDQSFCGEIVREGESLEIFFIRESIIIIYSLVAQEVWSIRDSWKRANKETYKKYSKNFGCSVISSIRYNWFQYPNQNGVESGSNSSYKQLTLS